jgi:hypothetical protein
MAVMLPARVGSFDWGLMGANGQDVGGGYHGMGM